MTWQVDWCIAQLAQADLDVVEARLALNAEQLRAVELERTISELVSERWPGGLAGGRL